MRIVTIIITTKWWEHGNAERIIIRVMKKKTIKINKINLKKIIIELIKNK